MKPVHSYDKPSAVSLHGCISSFLRGRTGIWNILSLMLLLMMVANHTEAQEPLTDQAGGKHVWYRTINTPHAVYDRGKTFVSFHGGGAHYLDPMVMSYDHETGTVQGPVKVGENPLAQYPDFHGNPAIMADEAGHLHVMYGGHGQYRGKMKHAVSERPGDIRTWKHRSNIEPEATYPTLFRMSDGTLYYFYRDGNHRNNWVYVTSTDNGRTFSEKTVLMKSGTKRQDGRYYESTYYDGWYGAFYRGHGDTIHYLTRYHACADDYGDDYHLERRVNLYHLMFTPGEGWRSHDGKTLQLPVTRETAEKHCKMFTSDPVKGSGQLITTLLGGVAEDAQGRMYINFGYGKGKWGRKWKKWRFATGRPGGEFSVRKAPASGSLLVEDASRVLMLGNTLRVTEDRGRNWKTLKTLRKDGLRNVAPVYNHHPEAILVGTGSDREDDRARKVFLWGENGFLP